jgi:RNA polymerase sigma-70 factor (ECF subfamily)
LAFFSMTSLLVRARVLCALSPLLTLALLGHYTWSKARGVANFPRAMETSPEAPLSPEVVNRLVGNHREFLGFLQKRLGDRALAEDILQEAFVRGLPKLDTIEKDESVTAWFYRILRNAVIDHYRRRSAFDRKLEAFATELDQQVEPESEMRGAVCRCVSELAGTLKPEYADVIRRVEVDGVSVKDYATEAGITGNNAAVRVFRAREALRKQVARSCGTCAEHGCLDCTCESSSGHHR